MVGLPGSDTIADSRPRRGEGSASDGGDYKTVVLPDVPMNRSNPADERRYTDRVRDARGKTGLADAVLVGAGKLQGAKIVAAVQDFDFMGGSLGTAAGEAVIAGMRMAVNRRNPFILFAASGGARMQEGAVSLMQMAKISAGRMKLDQARLPYLSMLTDPTTGGVTASYAMLGDSTSPNRAR